jgi:hypothetical protein
LKLSVRHGCSPNARQMRCTLVGEIPARRASSRVDQCVAPSGVSSSVRTTTTSSAWASMMVRGIAGRDSSSGPSRPLARKRARHVLTVPRLTPSRAAAARLLPPLRAGQHDPRPQGEALRGSPAPGPVL